MEARTSPQEEGQDEPADGGDDAQPPCPAWVDYHCLLSPSLLLNVSFRALQRCSVIMAHCTFRVVLIMSLAAGPRSLEIARARPIPMQGQML